MIELNKETSRTFARQCAVAGFLYFLIAAATIHLTSDGRDIATVWPANAVLTALLLLSVRSRWPLILGAGFVANAAANLITRGSLAGPLLYGLSNILEVTIVAGVLRADGRHYTVLQGPRTLARFVFVAGLVAPVLSGIFGAVTAFMIFDQRLDSAFATWVMSDALGLLIFTPVFLAVFRGDFAIWFKRAPQLARWEAAAHLAGTSAISAVVFFGAERPLLFVIYAPVMFITFRVGPLGTKLAVMLVAMIGAIATLLGHGPIVMFASDTISHAHMFQAFVAVLLLTCLPVAAEVSARARITEQLAKREEEMSRRAATDPLTGVSNRMGLEQLTSSVLASGSEPVCLIAIDVDHFKQINDRWGHAGGDRALLHIIEVMRSVVRPTDVVGRLGGDEFVLVLPGIDVRLGQEICSRMASELNIRAFSPDGQAEVAISLSCGLAAWRSGEGYEATLRRADEALYRAKAAGRNAFKVAA